MKKLEFLCSHITSLTLLAFLVGALSCRAEPPVTKLSAIAAGMEWVGKAVDEPDY